MEWIFHLSGSSIISYRRGDVEVERSPRMREIGVRSAVATDLSRKNR